MDEDDKTVKTPFTGDRNRPVKPNSDPHFAPGTILAGVYQVISFIGAGGMSNVYKCKDISIDRIVAVKALQTGYTEDSLRRFQTEGKAIAKFEHPNIVKLYGLHSVEDEEPVLVMEYIEGQTLSQLLKSTPNLPVERTLGIIGQICSGLKAAERAGIVHRDLKPSNIMLTNPGTDDETVKILDFGIAKIKDNANHDATKTGDIFGTPNYMSPEQALGKKCDSRSDQYALGCILFEMLSGRPPFTSENILSVILMHVQNPVPNLTEVTTQHLPSHLAYIVRKMMQKKPDDRYSSFDAVEDALRTVGQRVAKDTRKMELYGAVAFLLVGFFVFIFYIMHTHPASPVNQNASVPITPIASVTPNISYTQGSDSNSATAQAIAKAMAGKWPKNEDEMAAYQEQLVDDALNKDYADFIAKNEQLPDLKPRLLVAEKAWIEYRDAHLKSLFPDDTVSKHSSCYDHELMMMTGLRRSELLDMRKKGHKPDKDAKEMAPRRDSLVEETYQKALKRYKGSNPKLLEEAQNKWKIFRDAELKLRELFAKTPEDVEIVRLSSRCQLDIYRYNYLRDWEVGIDEDQEKCAGTRPIQ